MKWRRAVATTAIILLALIALAFALIIAALGTGWGTRVSLRATQAVVPELQFNNVSGNWLRGLHIGQLRWQDDSTTVTVAELDTRLRWLTLRNSLTLEPVTAARVQVHLHDANEADDNEPLPALLLPIFLNLPQVAVKELEIIEGDAKEAMQDIRGAVKWFGSTLYFSQLQLRRGRTQIAADGQISFTGNYPLRLRGGVRDPQLPGLLAVETSGDLAQMNFIATLEGQWPLRATGSAALLATDLPLQAKIVLLRATRWSSGEETVQFHSGEVQLRGNLKQLQGDLALLLEERRYGKSKLAAKWQWQPGKLTIAPQLALPQGKLQADCSVDLGEPLGWHCNGDLDRVPLTPWLQVIAGELSGAFNVNGSWAEQRLQLAVALPEFRGKLVEENIAGALQLRTSDGDSWQIPQFVLRAGPNQVSATGEFGTRNRFRIELDARELALLYPRLKGSAKATMTAQGNWPEPDVAGQLQAQNLQFEQLRLRQASANFDIQRLGMAASKLQLELRDLIAPGQPPTLISLNANGTRGRQELALKATQPKGNQISARCNGQLDADYSDWHLDCAELQGRQRNANTLISWRQSGPVRGRWTIANNAMEVQPFCIASEGAQLCLDQPLIYRDDRLQRLVAHGDNIPLAWLRPYFSEELTLQNDARGSLAIDLQSLAPLKLDAQARVAQSQWQWSVDNKAQSASLQDFELQARLDEQQADLSARVHSPTLGRFAAQLTVLDPRGRRELSGAIDIQQLQLAGFAWMVKGLDALTGQVDGRIQISGTADALKLNGQLDLEKGVIGWAPLGDLVHDIKLTGRFDNSSADFKGSFALGGGSGDIDGNLHWQEGADLWDRRMQLNARHLGATPLPDSHVVFAPNLALQITPGKLVATGQVDIEEAQINVKERPPETISVSPDEEIVGREIEPSSWQVLADIGLNLGDRFHFRGFGADVDLTGRLRLQQESSQLFRANGEVRVPKGRYRAYGQRLAVRSGSFIFTGPWDNPDLNLEAIRELPPSANPTNVVVGIKVTGPLRSPNAMLFSEPGMPESDIAYYILTGRPRATPQNNQFSAGGTLLALGLAGSGEQASKLAKQFGIGDFQIGTVASGGDTEAEMSGYVTEKLYVRYGRGLTQRSNSITFQYRLTPRLLIETITGIEDALDILYSFTLD